MAAEVVRVQPWNTERLADLFTLHLARHAPLPQLLDVLSFAGRHYRVVGILHFGDGEGPILLGRQLDQLP